MKSSKIQKKTVAIVGLGYVGLPLALLADAKNYRVIGIDRDKNKVNKINKKNSPYEDTRISDLLERGTLRATTDWKQIEEASIIVVCVPTPVHNNHKPNLNPVKNSCIQVAKHLQKGQLIILESTVNPGVCEEIVAPILEEISGLKINNDFHLAHCPERINPGDKKWKVSNIPRVIGSLSQEGLESSLKFYRSIIDAEIMPMSTIKEAEAVKIVENSFRDINIAFVNELAQSFDQLGIDVMNVIDGAATKPFSFLPHYPSCGVGGHCIPVDPYYLIDYAKKNGFKHRFLSLARKINNSMPLFTVNILKSLLEKDNQILSGTKVAVLGLAYKANIDDCRESPSFEIIKHLEEKGAQVSTYDPHVENLSTAKSLKEALQGAKAVVIATAHNIFRDLSPDFFIQAKVGIIVDGQNCLPGDKFLQAGLAYKGIGKEYYQ